MVLDVGHGAVVRVRDHVRRDEPTVLAQRGKMGRVSGCSRRNAREWYAEGPTLTPDWGIRFAFILLFPKK